MLSSLAKTAVVVLMAAPLGAFAMLQEQKSESEAKAQASGGSDKQEKKEQKKIEVKVLQLEKDGDKPQVKILLQDPAEKELTKQNFLGVGIEPVPPALSSQLPASLWKEQGLVVTDVQPDSPAAKAGLKERDVLVTYDDQKLFSPDQLTKLIRGDKVGREVVLGVVRDGQMESVKAKLGEREVPAIVALPGAGALFGADALREHRDVLRRLQEQSSRLQEEHRDALRRLQELQEKLPGKLRAGAQAHGSFSSMRIESTDGDNLKVEIEYKNEKGDSLKRSFEGSRDDIRKQIEADKELPEGIRNQLNRSLEFGAKGGRPGAFHFTIPMWDFSDADFPGAALPALKNLDQVIEQLSPDLDPAVREQLKGALRSIDGSRPKPLAPNRSL